MKTLVFIPTYRPGGIDITGASLARQTRKEFDVYVSDSYGGRGDLWTSIEGLRGSMFVTNGPPKKEGYVRNLAAAYNEAARYAVRNGYELFVSLQDYIWAPPDGLQRFVEISRRCPGDLITGLTSISRGPELLVNPETNSRVKDIRYSIFEKPFIEKPKEIEWVDCRIDGIYEYSPDDICLQILPDHWESNWAAVPVDYFRAGIFWDEEFDRGIAYENMDFARAAIASSKRRVIMDTRNHAISLPHKSYFEGEREAIVEHSNRKRYEERWG